MGEQIRIRTREKVRNIKKLDRVSVFSQRLRTAVVRSKDNYTGVGETKQATAGEYAEEKLKGAGARTAAGAEIAVNTRAKAIAETIKNTGARKMKTGSMKFGIKKSSRAAFNYARKAAAGTRTLMYSLTAGGSVAGIVIVVICLIGLLAGSCFGIFFSGEDTGNGMSMQTAVTQINTEYQAKIERIKADNKYDRVELINGQPNWPDVLSVYAVKTGAETDVVTMTDEKCSMLKNVFWAMNKISSRTETKNVTILKEIDDGKGNIVETESTQPLTFLYITVNRKTAVQMASKYKFTDVQKSQMEELLADENKGLWSSVLYGIGKDGDEIVKVALSQVGNIGGQPYWSWYGFGSRVEWCACFVSWCANECGYVESGVIPKFASCSWGVQWFKERGQWRQAGYVPRAGDLIFFDWDHNSEPDHVGIVESVSGTYVNTVEGNSSNVCRQRKYNLDSKDILGYGVPAF